MNDSGNNSVPLGLYLVKFREMARKSTEEIAAGVTFSEGTLARFEAGEATPTAEEADAILSAIGSTDAVEFQQFLSQDWSMVESPGFDHPDRSALWQANLTLEKLAELREDPEVKGVLVRHMDLYESEIRRLCEFLRRTDHQVAFIGGIGVGKSTAICKLAGLLNPDETKLDKQIVLETGAGGITLCEVHIARGSRYGLRIEPRSEESIRKDVEDFADYLVRITSSNEVHSGEADEGNVLGISKEVVRAIRNMSGLTEQRTTDEAGKRIRIDPAKELASRHASARELSYEILTRMNLLRRNLKEAWYHEETKLHPAKWLRQLFSEVNNGRNSEFTLPQKIEVVVPYSIFDSQKMPLRVIDTKGIDQTAERQDLECHLDDPRTLVVLCSRFNDAPEVAIQTLLNRAKESGIKDLSQRTTVLVLPRPEEALAVKHDDGSHIEDEEEGYELKADQVKLRLTPSGLGNIDVKFFNSREEPSEPLRNWLVQKIEQKRQSYATQIAKLDHAVESLIENRKNEQVRLVFEHVNSDLTSWIENNRTLAFTDERVEKPLIKAIDGTQYAATIRAAVSRYGNWHNLDYYNQLAHGIRTMAFSHLGGKIDQFRVIAENLKENPNLAPAKEFLERMLASVDATLDESCKVIQTTGRETFKQAIEQDFEYWSGCERRWGQGPGYRSDISHMTDERLHSNYEEAHRKVRKLTSEEWDKFVALLLRMLRNPEVAEAV